MSSPKEKPTPVSNRLQELPIGFSVLFQQIQEYKTREKVDIEDTVLLDWMLSRYKRYLSGHRAGVELQQIQDDESLFLWVLEDLDSKADAKILQSIQLDVTNFLQSLKSKETKAVENPIIPEEKGAQKLPAANANEVHGSNSSSTTTKMEPTVREPPKLLGALDSSKEQQEPAPTTNTEILPIEPNQKDSNSTKSPSSEGESKNSQPKTSSAELNSIKAVEREGVDPTKMLLLSPKPAPLLLSPKPAPAHALFSNRHGATLGASNFGSKLQLQTPPAAPHQPQAQQNCYKNQPANTPGTGSSGSQMPPRNWLPGPHPDYALLGQAYRNGHNQYNAMQCRNSFVGSPLPLPTGPPPRPFLPQAHQSGYQTHYCNAAAGLGIKGVGSQPPTLPPPPCAGASGLMPVQPNVLAAVASVAKQNNLNFPFHSTTIQDQEAIQRRAQAILGYEAAKQLIDRGVYVQENEDDWNLHHKLLQYLFAETKQKGGIFNLPHLNKKMSDWLKIQLRLLWRNLLSSARYKKLQDSKGLPKGIYKVIRKAAAAGVKRAASKANNEGRSASRKKIRVNTADGDGAYHRMGSSTSTLSCAGQNQTSVVTIDLTDASEDDKGGVDSLVPGKVNLDNMDGCQGIPQKEIQPEALGIAAPVQKETKLDAKNITRIENPRERALARNGQLTLDGAKRLIALGARWQESKLAWGANFENFREVQTLLKETTRRELPPKFSKVKNWLSVQALMKEHGLLPPDRWKKIVGLLENASGLDSQILLRSNQEPNSLNPKNNSSTAAPVVVQVAVLGQNGDTQKLNDCCIISLPAPTPTEEARTAAQSEKRSKSMKTPVPPFANRNFTPITPSPRQPNRGISPVKIRAALEKCPIGDTTWGHSSVSALTSTTPAATGEGNRQESAASKLTGTNQDEKVNADRPEGTEKGVRYSSTASAIAAIVDQINGPKRDCADKKRSGATSAENDKEALGRPQKVPAKSNSVPWSSKAVAQQSLANPVDSDSSSRAVPKEATPNPKNPKNPKKIAVSVSLSGTTQKPKREEPPKSSRDSHQGKGSAKACTSKKVPKGKKSSGDKAGTSKSASKGKKITGRKDGTSKCLPKGKKSSTKKKVQSSKGKTSVRRKDKDEAETATTKTPMPILVLVDKIDFSNDPLFQKKQSKPTDDSCNQAEKPAEKPSSDGPLRPRAWRICPAEQRRRYDFVGPMHNFFA